MIHRARESLAHVRELLPQPSDSQPTLVNMSWGTSPQRLVADMTQTALHAPAGSVLHADLVRQLGHPPTPHDRGAVTELFAKQVATEFARPQNSRRMDSAKLALASEVAQARSQGIVVFSAAGNEFARGDVTQATTLAQSMTHDVPGLIDVGAVALPAPGSQGADAMAPFSNGGEVFIAAPGVGVPVGRGLGRSAGLSGGLRSSLIDLLGSPAARAIASDPNPVALARPVAADLDGTSFAAPYALGAAALMVRANPHITPDQLERALVDAAHDLPGTQRDGAGLSDVVAAVEAARHLVSSEG